MLGILGLCMDRRLPTPSEPGGFGRLFFPGYLTVALTGELEAALGSVQGNAHA